jgi:MFS family permease
MITLKNKNVQAIIVLFCVWLACFIGSYAQNQLAGMSVAYMAQYGFTPEQYAGVYSASQFIGIFFAFFVGIISDKIGTRKIILIAAVLAVIGLVGRIFLPSYEMQYFCNVLVGFVALFMAVNRAKILGGWFPPATIAMAVGIAATTTPVANTLGVGLTAMMPSITVAFTISAVVAVVFFVIWFLFGKEKSTEIAAAEAAAEADAVANGSKKSVVALLVDVVKKPWVWIISAGALFVMAGQVPLMAFTNAALINARGLDPISAGGFATAITIGMGVGSVVTPFIVKFIKAYRPVIIIYAILGALGAYFGWQMPIGPVMYIVYFICGWSLGSVLAMIFTFPVMVYGREYAATAGGIVQVFVLAGASLMLTNVTIPLAGGGANYTGLFTLAAIYVVLGGICMFILPDQGKKLAAPKETKEEKAEAGSAQA